MEIFKLLGRIAIEGADDAKNEINSVSEEAEKSESKLSNGIKTAAKWGAAIAAGAVTAAGAMYKFATSTAATADNVDKMSQKIGISREAYQELDFICSQSGTSVDNLQMGMKTLTAAMDGAASGTAAQVEKFEQLGVSVTNADGSLRSQEEVLFDTLTALQGMENQTEKARLATELFGRSGSELMPLLNGATGSIDEMKQQAHDLGLVMNDETIDAGVKLTDTIDQAKRAFGAIVVQIGANVIPIVQKAAEKFRDWMPTLKDVISNVKDKLQPVFTSLISTIKDVITNISSFIKKLVDFATESGLAEAAMDGLEEAIGLVKDAIGLLEDAYNAIIDVITSVVDGIKDAVEWGQEHQTGLELIAIAVGTLTTAIVAYNVAQGIANAGGITAIATNAAYTVAIGALTVAETVATAATTAFGAVLAFVTSPVTLVIAAIGALIAIVVLLANHWDEIKEKTTEVFQAIADWISERIEDIKQFFSNLMEHISDIISKIIDFFIDCKNKIVEAFEGIADWFKEKFTAAYNNIKNAFSSIGSFFSEKWTAIKNVFNNTANWFGDLFGRAWTNIKEKFSSWASFWSNLWTQLKDKFSSVGTAIGTAMSDAVKTGMNTVITLVENTINSGIKLINKAIGLANKLPGVSVSKVDELSLPRLEKGGILEKGEVGLLEGNGTEAVVPLDQNRKWISKVAEDMNVAIGNTGTANKDIQELNDTMSKLINNLPEMLADAMTNVKVGFDKREVGRMVRAVNA